jgi:hypothetical protein
MTVLFDFPVQDLEVTDEREQDLRDRVHTLLTTRSELDPITNCWVYTGPWTTQGACGTIRIGRRVYRVARVSAWVYLDFDLWRSEEVFVDCDCNACFNPDHLRIASLNRWLMRRQHLKVR